MRRFVDLAPTVAQDGGGRRRGRPRGGAVGTAVVLAVVSLVGTAGCGDGVGPGAGDVWLPFDTLTLEAIGEARRLTVTVEGRSTETPEFRVEHEARWIGGMPVLDPDSLVNSSLVALAPGTVTLSVTAFDARPARLEVRVKPPGPTVVRATPTAVSAGDALVLEGYRMDEVRALTLGGRAASILGSDSASLRVRAALDGTVDDGACGGLGVPLDLAAEPGLVAKGVRVTRRRTGEITLAPGEAIRLTPEQAACLKVAPAGEYALAYHDTRMLRRAETGKMFDWELASVVLAVENRSDTPARSVAVPVPPRVEAWETRSGGAARLEAADSLCSTEDLLERRTRPWTLGERFGYCDNTGLTPPKPLEVFLIRGPLVFAIDDPNSLPGWAAVFDTAGTWMAAEIPFLNRTLDIAQPETGKGTGQILVRVMNDPQGPHGAAWPEELFINTRFGNAGALDLFWLLSHEIAHVWQWNHLITRRVEDPSPGSLSSRFASEGGASFVAYELVRRRLGIGLTDNIEWWPFEANWSYAQEAGGARGALHGGYDHGASFFRYLLMDRVAGAGHAYEDAMRDLLVGALEGFYGAERNGLPGPGLAPRMEAALGPGWSLGDALLRWGMAHAMDDRVTSPYQNRSFYRVSGHVLPNYGWRARAALGRPGDPTTVELSQGEGDVGFVTLYAPAGGTYRLQADSAAWMLGRIR